MVSLCGRSRRWYVKRLEPTFGLFDLGRRRCGRDPDEAFPGFSEKRTWRHGYACFLQEHLRKAL
jgi:hypothetical protein